MCGLFGYAGKANNYSKLERYIRVLAMETSERGTDATGFAALRDDGSFIGSKAAIPASKYVFHDPTFCDAFEMKPRLMVGHCRLATHGDKADNKNNHPHWSKDRMLSIVHNGIVFAHDKLADSIGAKMRGECDSEVILHMVEAAIAPGEKHCYDKLVGVAQDLDDFGAMFSVLTLDKARRCIWSFRNYSNPLVYWESEELGVTIFASTLEHITNAAMIVLGKRVAKSINAYSPEPGRVFRFFDDGHVTHSHRQADCTDASKSIIGGKFSSSSYYRDYMGLTDDEDTRGLIVPSSWNGRSQIEQCDLPHSQYCECVSCSIIRTADHKELCECAECVRVNRAMISDVLNGID